LLLFITGSAPLTLDVPVKIACVLKIKLTEQHHTISDLLRQLKENVIKTNVIIHDL
jgi:hypothetical protein